MSIPPKNLKFKNLGRGGVKHLEALPLKYALDKLTLLFACSAVENDKKRELKCTVAFF